MVKVLDIDPQGKIKLSRKQAIESPEKNDKEKEKKQHAKHHGNHREDKDKS